MHISKAILLKHFSCSFFFCLPFLFLVKRKVSGGHKWTRTIDLTLIRRAL